jgi:GT2 family glycosyltransferase
LNSTPTAAIVILNWNGRHHLQQFLPSVMSSLESNCEVVIADNGSTDESVSFIAGNYPAIKVIRLEKNFGFAKGYNEALKQIKADYFVILNSDVEVQPNWIKPMIRLLENDLTIAACQPKILSWKNRNFFDYAGAAGGWLDKYGYPFAKGRIFDICEEDRGQYDRREPIFWASGAAMFVRASIFHEIGGFDDYFFAHQEEIDLCWRMQLAGYKIYSCPESVVYHVGGGTLPRGNTKKTYLNFRNNQIMLYKNFPWSQKWWKIPYRIFLDNISAWKGLLAGEGGYFIAIVRAHLSFIKWILFFRKKSRFPQNRTGKLQGFYGHNLVWQHFIKKKKYFSQIIPAG